MLALNKLLQCHWKGSYWWQWFMGLPCLYQSKSNWKGKPYPLSEKIDCGGLMEPNLGARRTTKHMWQLQAEPQKLWRANQITAPNLSQPAPDKHRNDLQKQGFSATQEGMRTNPTMSIFGTKSALTSNPTHQPTGWQYGHRTLWILDHNH